MNAGERVQFFLKCVSPAKCVRLGRSALVMEDYVLLLLVRNKVSELN